jgi:SAM-dependent methyltransferase
MTELGLESWSGADWGRLRELREGFLRAEQGERPGEYWSSRRDLELYDASFARRIGWKWEAVLDELEARARAADTGVLPGGGTLVDFGCGTGIATRTVLGRGLGARRVFLLDRSPDAARFAAEQVSGRFPDVGLELSAPAAGVRIDLLLASHVLDELDEAGRAGLLALVRSSETVLWVEAGSRATSRALSALRDELESEFDVIAPCTHRARCGALLSDTDWCHFFARPPAEAFTSAGWRKMATELGLDLRSLPYSFLALRRAPAAHGGARVLGRPRILKGRAVLDVCDERGVREVTLLERTDPALYRRLERSAGEPLVLDLELEGQRVVRAERHGARE